MHRRWLIVTAVAAVVAIADGSVAAHRQFRGAGTTQGIADRVAQAAEQQRKDQAIAWLGKELPPWKEPCPVTVELNMNGPSGSTAFCFAPKGGVLKQHMELSGPLDRVLAAVLPHEITHTIFAHYLGRPVPRWADEGGAILAEDQQEQERNDKLMQKTLKAARQLPLRRLFTLHDYSPDLNKICAFYGQSYSVSRYLIETGGRPKFLDFMKRGYHDGWDEAAQVVYGHPNVEALERAWMVWVQKR